MPLDHFIPQVHLKNFGTSVDSNYVHAIEKGSLNYFPTHTKKICRIMDGNTNPYLAEQRAVEEFLDTIEPKYNYSVEKLRHGKIDFECIYSIAGYIAYVLSCSPCAMRTNSQWLARLVEIEALHAEKKGLLPERPAVMRDTSLSDMFKTGDIGVKIDGKYPQALGIAAILSNINSYGNFQWEILLNNFPDSPFLTSDFPIAIEKTIDPKILNRIVPLTPNLALRIRPVLYMADHSGDEISFNNFSYKIMRPMQAEIRVLNRLIVQCAERFVFYNDHHPWIPKFVAKNSDYHLESVMAEIPHGTGMLLHTTLAITKSTKMPKKFKEKSMLFF